MKPDTFIEREKVAGHSVQKTCGLFEVSRAAYYQRRTGSPSARAITDAELTEQIQAVHAESKGTYGSPRVHRELGHRGVVCGRRRDLVFCRAARIGRESGAWRPSLGHQHRRPARPLAAPADHPIAVLSGRRSVR
jgi:putative transposase